jgi:hypothetical protein
MIDQDFDQAKEKAVLVGAAYDFGKLVQGLRADANLAWGWDVINPSTGKKAPNQAEYDVTVDYRPPSGSTPSRASGRGCGSARARPSSISRTPRRSVTSSGSPSTGIGT